MSEHIWDTFDGLFKTVNRQGRQIEELETRIFDLERRLQERAASPAAVASLPQPAQKSVEQIISEMPTERAA